MQLTPILPGEFPTLYTELCRAFPKNERRDEADARALLARSDYRPLFIESEGERVGLFSLFDLGELLFIEHFLILPEHRNRGLGAGALSLLAGRMLVLEIELPTTPMAKRRLGFYERNGFFVNALDYAQPPYRNGDAPTPMHLLSSPARLPRPWAVAGMLYEKIYQKEWKGL